MKKQKSDLALIKEYCGSKPPNACENGRCVFYDDNCLIEDAPYNWNLHKILPRIKKLRKANT